MGVDSCSHFYSITAASMLSMAGLRTTSRLVSGALLRLSTTTSKNGATWLLSCGEHSMGLHHAVSTGESSGRLIRQGLYVLLQIDVVTDSSLDTIKANQVPFIQSLAEALGVSPDKIYW